MNTPPKKANDLQVEKRLDWYPNFKNEISITDKRKRHEFSITLKDGEDIEIECSWDYGYGGSGCEIMHVPTQMIKDFISELENSTK